MPTYIHVLMKSVLDVKMSLPRPSWPTTNSAAITTRMATPMAMRMATKNWGSDAGNKTWRNIPHRETPKDRAASR